MDYLNQTIFSKLVAISSRINSAENLDILLNLIMKSAQELIACEGTSLLLLDAKNNRLNFNVALGKEGTHIVNKSISLDEGIVGLVARSGESIISNSAQDDDRVSQAMDCVIHYKTASLLCVPMKVQGKVVGVLEAINAVKGHFAQQDKALLSFLANIAAIAIKNRMLFTRLNKTNDNLNSRMQELKYLYKLSIVTRDQKPLNDMMDIILEGVIELVKAKKASLLLYDPIIKKLRVRAIRGEYQNISKASEISPDEGIVGLVFKSQAPLLITDIKRELPHIQMTGEWEHLYDSHSFVSVPIIDEGKSVGVINLTDKFNQELFNSFDLQVITSVASYIAKLYQTYQLKDQIREQNRIKKEMEIASILQHRFLPGTIPQLDGLDIAISHKSSFEISGEFYDFIKIDDSKIGLAMCQVSGKGVPAALSIALFKNMLRGQVQRNASPKFVVNLLNQQFCEDSTAEMNIQAFYGVIDIHNRIITYVSTGIAVNISLFKKDQIVDHLINQKLPLGQSESMEYHEYVKQFEKDDIIFAWIENNHEGKLCKILKQITHESHELLSYQLLKKLENSKNIFPKNELNAYQLLIAIKTVSALKEG